MAKSGLCGVVWTTARLRLAARGKKKKKKKKNTYRRLPTLTFPVITIHILSFNSLQLPEVAVTLKQSILHSLTDFIMPPNRSMLFLGRSD